PDIAKFGCMFLIFSGDVHQRGCVSQARCLPPPPGTRKYCICKRDRKLTCIRLRVEGWSCLPGFSCEGLIHIATTLIRFVGYCGTAAQPPSSPYNTNLN